MRKSKDVDGTIYTYYYIGEQLSRMVVGDLTLDFFYDASGRPLSMRYTSGGTSTDYYYITNLQGDVIRLVDSYGNIYAEYLYSPFGDTVSSSGPYKDINPLRYRGYVYDHETGLYYLRSRYYDPKVGRFINADSYASTGQGVIGCNMFAYCLNNPIIYGDPSGYAAGWTNLVNICDGGTSRFIYNQNDNPYDSMMLGVASVAHGGCGPVSINNAAQLLGNNCVNLAEIIAFYTEIDGFYLGGLLGSSMNSAARFFELNEYDTVILSADEIYSYSGIESTFDVGIILYWYETPSFPYFGAHYVAFRQYDTVGYYYNVFSNSADVYQYHGYLVDFLESQKYSPIKLLLISGGS